MNDFSKYPICGSDFITEEYKNKLRAGLAQLEDFKDYLESIYIEKPLKEPLEEKNNDYEEEEEEEEEDEEDEWMQRILGITEVFLDSYVEPRNEIRLNGFIELWEKDSRFLNGLYENIIEGLKIRKAELENEKTYEDIPMEEEIEEEQNNNMYSGPETLKSIDITSTLLFSQIFVKTAKKLIKESKITNVLIYSHRFDKLARG